MVPALHEGSVVLTKRKKTYHSGQVVIVNLRGREIIKRISNIKHGLVFLEGDNKNRSKDSRH